MWCLAHVLDHLDLGLDSILGGIGAVLTKVGRLFYTIAEAMDGLLKASKMFENC